MKLLIHELIQALRSLRRSPGFTTLVVLVLGVGLGSTIFMLGAINGYIIQPLPFTDAHELMHLERHSETRDRAQVEVGQLELIEWRRQQQSFEGLAGFYSGTVNLSGAGADRPERYDGAFITGNAFELLDQSAMIGRTLAPRDSRPGADPVVVISHAVWMHRYNGDDGIIGRTIRINARDAVVVGVMPPGFAFPIREDVWVPLVIDPATLDGLHDGATLEVLGRLADGVTADQARAEFDAIAARLAESYPEAYAEVDVRIQPFAWEYVDQGTRTAIYTMTSAVVLVLIMACVNTANLVLVRATRRGRELAIRSALGASRWRLIARVMAECLVLSLLATALGWLLSGWAGKAMFNALRAGDSQVPFWVDMSTDATLIALTAATAIVATLLSGLLPALRGTRVDVNEALKDGGGGTSNARAGRVSRGLVVFEIALSCVLLVCAGLMLRTVVNIDQRDYGVDTDRVLISRMGLFEDQYPTAQSQIEFYHTLDERLASRPDVEQAAIASALPGAQVYHTKHAVPGRGDLAEQFDANAWIHMSVTTSGAFDLLDIPLLQGRVYDRRDRMDGERVVVVSRRLADAAWPNESAIGRQIALDGDSSPETFRTVIGVVDDVHLGDADDDPTGSVFLPLSQNPLRFAYAAVRTRGDPMAFGGEMRDVVQSLDPDLPVYWLQTLQYWIDMSGWVSKLVAFNFEVFGAIALILAAVGMYGVLAYSVAQRTREFGVRRAMGASDRRILAGMARQMLRQLAIGLGVGLVLAFFFAQAMSGMLVDVDPGDPWTYLGVAVVLVLVAALAAAVPTWRALRVEPTVALRHE